jgi:hypothetical protein
MWNRNNLYSCFIAKVTISQSFFCQKLGQSATQLLPQNPPPEYYTKQPRLSGPVRKVMPVFDLCVEGRRVARFSWSKHTKFGKNIPNDHKLVQMVIKYHYIFHPKALPNSPKLQFLVWKQTIRQPCRGVSAQECRRQLENNFVLQSKKSQETFLSLFPSRRKRQRGPRGKGQN